MKNQCDCCGTCCRNGGPPLHVQDIELIRSMSISFDDMVTVRRGEMVLPPFTTIPVPAQSEWIKIQGVDGEWRCRFLDTSSNSCSIYTHRPSSCRALKCWDTEQILAMAGHDLLARSDLIESNDPLLPFVQLHEKRCPVPDLEDIVAMLAEKTKRNQLLMDLTSLVETDLKLRSTAAQEFNISVARELFYFGRPLFQILIPLGIVTKEESQGIVLQFRLR